MSNGKGSLASSHTTMKLTDRVLVITLPPDVGQRTLRDRRLEGCEQ